jgi:hypothetical protein
MAVQHYFDSSGEWIAYRRDAKDRYLFDWRGYWVGWFLCDFEDVIDLDGNYLATVVDGNRLFRNEKKTVKMVSPIPRDPGLAGYAAFPGRAVRCPLPAGFQDVAFEKAVNPQDLAGGGKRLPFSSPPTPMRLWISRLLRRIPSSGL